MQGIYVTGSPAYVTDKAPWSEQTASYLKQAVDNSIPILGICYGHQLLAHCLGGEVDFHPQGREIGTVGIELTSAALKDPLFSQMPKAFYAQVSHLQSVLQLPAGAERLASNDFDENHGFRFGGCAWGVQFHPEFSAEVIAAYIKHRSDSIMKEGLVVEALLGGIKPTPEAASLLGIFARYCFARR